MSERIISRYPGWFCCRGCHRTVLMAIDGFSVIGSDFAVYGFIEITAAKLNDANRARTVIIHK